MPSVIRTPGIGRPVSASSTRTVIWRIGGMVRVTDAPEEPSVMRPPAFMPMGSIGVGDEPP